MRVGWVVPLVLVSCAPHDAAGPPAPITEPTPQALDEQAAVELAQTYLISCAEDTFDATLKTWGGEKWWNVECLVYGSLARQHHSLWLRQKDGTYHRGASWRRPTAAGYAVGDAQRFLVTAALRDQLGLSQEARCGPDYFEDDLLRCNDGQTVYLARVDPKTGEAVVERSFEIRPFLVR